VPSKGARRGSLYHQTLLTSADWLPAAISIGRSLDKASVFAHKCCPVRFPSSNVGARLSEYAG
jgi:hypothetical protein